MNNVNTESNNALKEAVLARLEKEKIEPHSRLYWLTQESVLWLVWGVTICIGAAALAVLSFASLHIGYALYEATHDNFLTFAIDSLPYLWLLAFGLMVLAAQFNLRRTKRGYKYPVLMVAGSSVGFSILGAMLLHYVGAGWYFDRLLGETLPSYQSRGEFEEKMWQRPLAGRLVGRVSEAEIGAPLSAVSFVDVDQKRWYLATSDLGEREAALLKSGGKVRVIAATSTEFDKDFLYACAVFPWLLDHAPFVREWREDRRVFVEDLREGKEKFKLHLERIEKGDEAKEEKTRELSEVASNTPPGVALIAAYDPTSPCATIPLFNRP